MSSRPPAVNGGYVGRPWPALLWTLPEPRQGGLIAKLAASRLCHSDDHIATGDLPVIGGGAVDHEVSGLDAAEVLLAFPYRRIAAPAPRHRCTAQGLRAPLS